MSEGSVISIDGYTPAVEPATDGPLEQVSLSESAELANEVRIDLAAYRDLSPQRALDLLPPPVWKGIQREGTVTLMAGESKAKKSWLAMAKAQHALLGKPFLGHEMPPTSTGKPRKALLMDFELPREVFLFRWIALAGEHDDEEREVLFDPERVSVECYRPRMDQNRDWIAHCCSRVLAYCAAGDIATVDCLQPIMPGDRSANDAEVVRPIIAKFQAAATQSGTALELVDHFNKSEGQGKNRIAGSVAKAAGADTIITLGSKSGGICIGFDLRMDAPKDDIHVQFEPYEFKVFTEEQLEERKESIQAEKDAKMVHEMFPDGQWYSKRDLATRLDLTKQAVDGRIDKIEHLLEVNKEGKAHLFRFAKNRGPGEK